MARFRMGRWVLSFGGVGPTGALADQPLMDDDRSQFPYDLASGYWAFPGSTAFTSMLGPNFVSGTSVINFWFKPETVIITNDAGTTNKVLFYDGQSASAGVRSAFGVILKASDTLFVGKEYLRGMYFVSGVFVSNLAASITVRIGGKLMKSIAGQL